jgi:hypothetical protein
VSSNLRRGGGLQDALRKDSPRVTVRRWHCYRPTASLAYDKAEAKRLRLLDKVTFHGVTVTSANVDANVP